MTRIKPSSLSLIKSIMKKRGPLFIMINTKKEKKVQFQDVLMMLRHYNPFQFYFLLDHLCSFFVLFCSSREINQLLEVFVCANLETHFSNWIFINSTLSIQFTNSGHPSHITVRPQQLYQCARKTMFTTVVKKRQTTCLFVQFYFHFKKSSRDFPARPLFFPYHPPSSCCADT